MFAAQGQRGRLLAVYAEAAQLGAWSATTGDTLGRETRFEAALLSVHPVCIAQEPLTIAVRLGAYEWRWLLQAFRVHDGMLWARSIEEPVVYPANRR
jgi:hypothetical protein